MSDTRREQTGGLRRTMAPPTTRPGAPLPPPPPAAPPPPPATSQTSKVPSGLSGTLQGFMWTAAATLAISAFWGLAALALRFGLKQQRQLASGRVRTCDRVFWLLQNFLALVIFVLIIA